MTNVTDVRKIAIAGMIGIDPRKSCTGRTIGLDLRMTVTGIERTIIAQPMTTTDTTMIGMTIMNQGINGTTDDPCFIIAVLSPREAIDDPGTTVAETLCTR